MLVCTKHLAGGNWFLCCDIPENPSREFLKNLLLDLDNLQNVFTVPIVYIHCKKDSPLNRAAVKRGFKYLTKTDDFLIYFKNVR